MAAVAVVVGWRLTVPLGLAAAALGALGGSLLADRLSRRPAKGPEMRRSVLLVFSGVALFLGFHLARAFVGSELLGSLLGPVPALHLGEALLWLGLVLPVVFALRFAAGRSETMAVIEVVAVGGAFAFAFAAHREGMVHRPLGGGGLGLVARARPAVDLPRGRPRRHLPARRPDDPRRRAASGSRSISACCC